MTLATRVPLPLMDLKLPIQQPILLGLGQMQFAHLLSVFEIGDGAGPVPRVTAERGIQQDNNRDGTGVAAPAQ